jgi:two-component system, response regulator
VPPIPVSDGAILFVEDSTTDQALTLGMLRLHRVTHAVVVVGTGAAALDYLFGTGAFAHRNPSDLPLAVLLDLRLPGVDGIDVLRRIRADPRTQALPVIVLTGSQDDVHAMQTFALHASSFLQKPLTFEAFEQSFRKLGLWPYLRRAHGTA